MIQINIPMPKNCLECPFRSKNEIGRCIASVKPGLIIFYGLNPDDKDAFVEWEDFQKNMAEKRDPRCPLIEIKEPEHFKFEIPQKCKNCKSMFSDGPNFYCHMEVVSPENSESDISTAYVDPESRPEWCSIVKMNTMFETMPPERREEFDKIATGLSALFGSVQVSKEE